MEILIKQSFIGMILLFLIYKFIKKDYDMLNIAFFLAPFGQLNIDIGLRLSAFQMSIVLILLSFLFTRSKIHKISPLIIIYLFFSIIITILFSVFLIDIDNLNLGFLRSEGRFITQIFLILLVYSLVFTISKYLDCFTDIIKYIKTFIFALILLCILGILQFFVFTYLHIDIFPIYIRDGAIISGIDIIADQTIFRISSLGGEPKTLAVSLAIGIVLLHSMNQRDIYFSKYDVLLKILFLVVLFATLSTSGYALIIILSLILFIFSINQIRNIKFTTKKLISIVILSMISIYYISNNSQNIGDIIQKRLLDRNISTEDFDYPIQEFFKANPEYIWFGSGLGNIHNLAKEYIPQKNLHYMQGIIFSAKSGYLKQISNIGLIGFSIFLLFNFIIIKRLNKIKELYLNPATKNIIDLIKISLVLVLFAYLARSYAASIYILVLSIANYSAYNILKEGSHEN